MTLPAAIRRHQLVTDHRRLLPLPRNRESIQLAVRPSISELVPLDVHDEVVPDSVTAPVAESLFL
jgi:hypothetical protein